MEALEPGRPLSFLDAHIKCGNSLLGATPDLIAAGIPDACKGASSTAGVGFEPTSDLAAANGFQDRPVRPLRHPAWSQGS